MEANEQNIGNNFKRQRAPLSESEEGKNGQKRCRMDSAVQENYSPAESTSRNLPETEQKPDTPIVPSVQSRVLQFRQRRGGGTPSTKRCLSDPGADTEGFTEQLLGEGEFNQRMEKFKVPICQSVSAPSSANRCLRTCSNFVSDVHQKLQDSPIGSERAFLIRQEREKEFSRLHFQPIRENPWLKKSSSDSSLKQVDAHADMKDGSFNEAPTLNARKQSINTTDVELSSHDEINTTEIIDQMFKEVLEYAGEMEEDRNEDAEDQDSGIVACLGDKDKSHLELEKEERLQVTKEESDELFTFPTSDILSPLSKSIEGVTTCMRLAVSQESNPLSLLTPEKINTPPAEPIPLYSIDAYRTQRQNKLPTIQSVSPGIQTRAPEKSQTQQSVNTKERIAAFNEEAAKLQTVINQTLQALSCCTDEEHGQGSLEEAEAEKLLLVSCRKQSALLSEVARLREESNSGSSGAARNETEYFSQQPCRGTLKADYKNVSAVIIQSDRPSHCFFILIRYGPCNIVSTRLATTADAQNGDTISFPTSVTLKDICSSFEIDLEVYSLSHTSGNNCSIDQSTTKSRGTLRKLLNTITRYNNPLASATPPNLSAHRSSNFILVGSHKITLASLGHSKFPLDKVPFLSPLEGSIYLELHSESHSNVQHEGFLTLFELIDGYGLWHRCYFVLEKSNMYYWNHPSDKETKKAEGSISLSTSPSQCVRLVKRDSCARPFTFELVSNTPNQQQDDNQEALAKCWFSADTNQERLDWMEKLNQALLDFHTWNSTAATQTESGQ